VTSIGRSAFYGCSSLPVIDGIRYADTYLVEATDKTLSTYTIKESTRWIGENAFESCGSLTSITIPNSVTSIGDGAFPYGSSLTSPVYNEHIFAYMPKSYLGDYTIPAGIKSIASGAFSGCSSLTSVTIPNSVTSIGWAAFEECSSLTSVTIPESVTSIGNHAFSGCTGLTSVTIGSGVIGRNAFLFCENLYSVTLGDGVTSIEDEAFWGCRLGEITIPKSVINIGKLAFSDCSLGYINVDAANPVYSDIDGVLFNKDQTILLMCPESYFSSCLAGCFYYYDEEMHQDVQGVDYIIPNSVTNIGDSAFYSSSYWWDEGVSSVIIPEGVTSIGNAAFYDYYLTEITCKAETPPALGTSVFGSSSIQLYVPAGSVDAYKAADQWKNLNVQTITFPASGTCGAQGDNLTWELSSEGELTISGTGAMANYGAHEAPWYAYHESITTIVMADGVTTIGHWAFSNCGNLTSVTIPNSVTSIGNYAFWECSTLPTVTIPNSVTSIGKDAFWYCNGLTSVTCEANTPPTCDRSFFRGRVSKSIPLYVPAESVEAYKAADQWKDFDVQAISCVLASGTCGAEGDNLTWELSCDGVLTISGTGDMAEDWNPCSSTPWYANREAILSAVIEDGVTNISNYAFLNCVNITSIEIPNSVTSIGEWAFRGCSSLTFIDIPNSVTSIGRYAFVGCSNLTSITIPASVTTIEDYALAICYDDGGWGCPSDPFFAPQRRSANSNCDNLTSITCYAVNPPDLGDYVFDGVDKSIPLYVPVGSVEAYKSADQWKDFNVQAIAEEQQGGTTDDYCFDIAKLGEQDVFRCIDADFGVVSESNVNMMFGWKYSYSSKNHSRHTLITKPGKDDICGDLDVLPSDKIACVRMAADSYTETDNAKGAICGYYLDVTNDNAIVTLQYAAVMHNPGHEIATQNGFKDYAQPYIKIEVLKLNEGMLDEYAISHYPSDASTIEGWKEGYDADGNAIVWKDWSDVTFDFSEYIGQRIAICFSTYDCAESDYNSENQRIVICKNRHQVHLYFTFNQVCDLPEDMLAVNKTTVNYQDYSITYELSADTAIVVDITSESLITEYNGMVCLKKIDAVIPEYVNYNGKDYTVTSIGAFATVNMPTLQTLTLPATIKSMHEFGLAVPYEPYYPNDENSKRYSEFMSEVTINTLSPIFIEKYLLTLSADNLDWDMFQNVITTGLEKVSNARNNIAQLQSQLTELVSEQNVNVGCVPYKQFFNIQESVRLLNTRLEALQDCSDMYERMDDLCKHGRKVEGGYEVLEETNMLAVEIAHILHGFNLYVPTSVASAYTQESETYWKLQEPVNPEKYRFIVKTSDPSMGYVCEVDDYFTQHAQLTISAFPNSDLYRFIGWSDGNTNNPRVINLTQDTTLTAVFAKDAFHIVFVNYDGSELQSGQVGYGTTPAYTGATPAKPADEQYTYTFAGWTPEITAVTGDATYTATFTPETIYYILTVSAGAHGSVNDGVNGTYTAGTEVMTEATPDRFYVFDRWSDGSQDNPRAVTMDADKTLTASFRIADVIELEDNHKADDLWWTDYANLVTSLGDTKKDVRYLRDLPTGKWCVFALPFDYSFRSGNTLKGGVYEMYRADYTDDGQLFLYFAPVTTKINANRPYLYRSATGDSKPLFTNVELQAVADGSYSVDNTNTTVGGEVTIHNTTAAMLLAKEKSVIYLDNNRLYYPNLNPDTDTWMRAFRGYFTLDGMSIRHIAPRVRIVVEGETVTELEVVSEDGAEADTAVRKYMENGILVIERNGVRYDATGARID